MTIEAQLPGGLTLQFPDGTPDAIVQGAVKQQLSTQTDNASQTPESKLGLTPAPETKPPPADAPVTTFDEYGRPLTDGVPPSMTDEMAAAAKAKAPNTSGILPIFPAPAPGAVGRIVEAAREGGTNTPDASGWAPGGLQLGRYIVNPLLEASGALFRGGQQLVSEAVEPVGQAVPFIGHPGLGRDVAALPEAFPTGDYGQPTGPGTALQARNALYRTTPQVPLVPQAVTDAITSPFSARRPISLQEITDAIKQSEIQQNRLMPGAAPPPSGPVPQQTASQEPPAQPAPDFVPPGSPIARVRPAEIPPTGARSVDEQGVATPIQPPPDRLAPGAQPQSGAAAASTDGWRPVGPREVFPGGMRFRMNTTTGQSEVYDPQPAGGGAAGADVTRQPTTAAGAQATPTAQAGLTPEQAAAAGSTADKQWFYKTIIPGERNNIQYIDGITPTMAQQELSVNAARDSKNLRRISEDADQNERALLGQHSEIRKNEFQDIAGSDVTQQADMKAANDQIEQQLQAAYAHGGTVNLQPVIDATNAELTGSAGKLPPLRAAMKEIQDAAQKSDGSGLETNPLQANAVRRAIIYMQSKQGRLANPGYGAPDVMAALTRVKDTLTKQIEPAAPGFTKANADYAAARQAVDAREALQEYEPKLYTGPLGNMTFAPFHRMMGDVIAGRDPNAPLNPYKALTEHQVNRLKSLHDDLQRAASAEELSKAAGGGSDTSQTLFDMAKKAARGGISTLGGAGVGMAVGHYFPSAGVSAGMFTKSVLDNLFSQRAVARATAEHNRLLRPDVTQYPLKPNPLMQPPP